MSDISPSSAEARLVTAGKVQGTPVFDRSGERVGTIKDIYIDKLSGRAEFASVALGAVLVGVGVKYHPLPWSALDYDTEQQGFVVGVEKRFIEESPAFEDEQLSDLDSGWGGEVDAYYKTPGFGPFI